MSLAPGSLREFCKYIARADSSRAGPQLGGEFADADRRIGKITRRIALLEE
jgi:hypothetical protein